MYSREKGKGVKNNGEKKKSSVGGGMAADANVLGWGRCRGGGVASEVRDGWATFPGLCSCLSSCGSVYSQRLLLLLDWGGGQLNGSWGQWVRVSPLRVAAIPPWDSHLLPSPRHTASSVTVGYACRLREATGISLASWKRERIFPQLLGPSYLLVLSRCVFIFFFVNWLGYLYMFTTKRYFLRKNGRKLQSTVSIFWESKEGVVLCFIHRILWKKLMCHSVVRHFLYVP